MFQLKQVTAPSEPVVSVTELKEYLRIDNDLEDGRLAVMELAAVKRLEDLTSHKFVTQVWDVFLDNWPRTSSNRWWDGTREVAISEVVSPSRNITLPIGIGRQLLEFSTFSDEQEFPEDVSNYIFDAVGPRARVGLKIGGVWPTTILRPNNAIRFRIEVGFGSASQVPKDIIQAVKEFVAHMYENRGDQNEMVIPPHILMLIQGYRREKLGC
jgi:hypothetical protein